MKELGVTPALPQHLMEHISDSMAWLAKRDGSVVVGHGPFTESAGPPSEGVAFYVQDFALEDARPWKTPSRVERTTTAEMAARFRDTPPLDCEWSPLDAAPFSVIFHRTCDPRGDDPPGRAAPFLWPAPTEHRFRGRDSRVAVFA
jgi:hypothetical protein